MDNMIQINSREDLPPCGSALQLPQFDSNAVKVEIPHSLNSLIIAPPCGGIIGFCFNPFVWVYRDLVATGNPIREALEPMQLSRYFERLITHLHQPPQILLWFAACKAPPVDL